MKVFLDANILFSGAREDAPIRQLLDYLMGLHVELISNAFAAEEARRNVNIKRPAWAGSLETLIDRIVISKASATLDAVDIHDKDRPILRSAVGSRSTHLLTGDFKHFGHLLGKTVQGVKVISARMLVDELGITARE